MTDITQQQVTALEKKVGQQAKSPLFTQLAYFYLVTHRAQDALHLCDAGLAHFPFYTTGHLIKGKALLALNMRAEARRELEFVLSLLPNNETVASLLSQIPKVEEESTSPPQQEIQPVAAPPQHYESSSPGPELEQGVGENIFSVPEPKQETPPLVTASQGTTLFDTVPQMPQVGPTEASLGFEMPSVEAPTAPEPSISGDFNFPPQGTTPFFETPPPSTEQPSQFDLTTTPAAPEFTTPTAPSEEESFEKYARRRRTALSGENTISLDDYFNSQISIQPSPQVPPISSGVQNKIEELAGKLQNVGKITPVIDLAQRETTPATEQDTPAGMGFVTPTLAEIYAKQGWFDDAIKAYKTLARNKPAERERFEKRIAELEELKNQQTGG